MCLPKNRHRKSLSLTQHGKCDAQGNILLKGLNTRGHSWSLGTNGFFVKMKK